MTLNANDSRDEYTSGAAQAIFNYTFKIFASTDLDVYVTLSGQECSDSDLTTAYSVTGVGVEAGGTITLNTPASSGDLVTIVSSIPTNRTTDYQNNGDFRPDTVNDDFDRTVSLVKQVSDTASRSLVFDKCQQGVSSLSLPTPESERFMRWKGDLSGMENTDPPSVVVTGTTLVSVSSYVGLRTVTGQALDQVVSVAFRSFENDGGGGNFRWDDSDLSTQVTADTESGVYVAPNSDATGASGAWVRSNLVGPIFSEWFGAIADASTDCSTALQAAVDFKNSITDGVEVKLNPGTYKLTVQVVQDSRSSIIGSGMNSTRINSATGLSPFKIIDSGGSSNVVEGASISHLSISLDNAAIGIEVSDVWWATIEYVRFRDGGASTGTLIKSSGQAFHTFVSNCRFVGAQNFCIDFQDDVNSSIIEGNDFNMPDGAVAINIADCSHIAVFNNRFEQSASDAGNKIVLTNANNCPIYGNTMGNSLISVGISILGTSQQNQIFGNRIAIDGTGSIGVTVGGTADFNSITGNSFLLQGTGTNGVEVNGRTNTSITGNNIQCTGALTEAAISLKASASQCTITGNVLSYTGAGNQSTGVLIASGTLDTIISSNTFEGLAVGVNTQANNGSPTQVITANTFRSNTTDITIGTATSNKITNNIGYVTENTGTGSIPNGAMVDTVAHGLDAAPAIGKINIVFTEDPTNTPGAWWISAVDGTSFVIRVENDPGGSNLDFSWSVSG